jgi:hypothetical protein
VVIQYALGKLVYFRCQNKLSRNIQIHRRLLVSILHEVFKLHHWRPAATQTRKW